MRMIQAFHFLVPAVAVGVAVAAAAVVAAVVEAVVAAVVEAVVEATNPTLDSSNPALSPRNWNTGPIRFPV